MKDVMKSHFLLLQVILLVCIGMQPACAEFPVSNADFTGNGRVDFADYAILASSWQTSLPWWPDGLVPQMVAHWPLDQDAMDNQFMFDGVANGSITWYSKKTNPSEVKIGNGSIGLDGQDYLEINASEFPHFYGSFTLDVWIKTNYTQQLQTILSKGNTSWQIGIAAGKVIFLVIDPLPGCPLGAAAFIMPDGMSGTIPYDFPERCSITSKMPEQVFYSPHRL